MVEKDAPILVRFCDNSDTRSRWLRALALTRGVNEAVANARVIEILERSEALRAVAEALAKAGLADQAKDAALQAKDAALQIEEPSDRSQALPAVAEALFSVGLGDDSRKFALSIKDAQIRSQALACVAGAMARAQQFCLAREVADSCDSRRTSSMRSRRF